jgi:multiple sugar transport system substrate-binding protein
MVRSARLLTRVFIILSSAILFLGAAVAAKSEITFLATADGTRLTAYQAMVDRFNETHPGITAKLQATTANQLEEKVKVMMVGAVAPDVFGMQLEWCQEIYEAGWAEPLDRLIQRDRFDLANLPPVRDSYMYKGRWYGMPYVGSGFLFESILYNKAAFAEAGLPLPNSVPEDPQQGWTWEEFRSSLRRLTQDTDGDGAPNRFGGNFMASHHPTWVFSNGGSYYDEAGTRSLVDQPAFVEAIQWWADLRHKDLSVPQAGMVKGNLMNQFASRDIAMFAQVYFIAGSVMAMDLSFDWGLAEWPRGRAGTVALASPNPMGIAATSKHKDEAWEFIKFWLSDEVQYHLVIEARVIPPQTHSLLRKYSKELLFPDKAPYDFTPYFLGASRMYPVHVRGFNASDFPLINDAIGKVWGGEVPAVTALGAAAEVINARLARVGAPSF